MHWFLPKKSHLENSQSIGDTYLELANIHYYNHQYELAKTYYNNSLKIYTSPNNKDNKQVGHIINGLGNVAEAQTNYDEAIRLYKKAINIFEKDKNMISVAITTSNIADIYVLQSEYKKAEPLYKRAIDITIKIEGQDSIETINRKIDLAELYLEDKKYNKAEPIFIKAKKILEAKIDKNNNELGILALVTQDLGVLKYHQKRYDEAIVFYKNSIEIREKNALAKYFGNINNIKQSSNGISKSIII